MKLRPQLNILQINPRLIRITVIIRVVLHAGLHRGIQLRLSLLIVLVEEGGLSG